MSQDFACNEKIQQDDFNNLRQSYAQNIKVPKQLD